LEHLIAQFETPGNAIWLKGHWQFPKPIKHC